MKNVRLQSEERRPLSVIIPAHNAEMFLDRCLTALKRSDLTDVEVIVVDDASTDGTAEVADRHGVRRLTIERQAGPAAARNLGARTARHSYLLFLDSDVIVPATALQSIRETLSLYSHRDDVAGVLGQYGEETECRDFLTNFKNLTTCYLYAITDTQSPYLHTPIFCIRKEVLEGVGGFDPRLWRAEDFRLGIVLGSRGYKFIIDRRIKGVHLKRYSLRGALVEDWRRIRDLQSLVLSEEERAFALKAHRWTRLLSVCLPGPALVSAAAMFLDPRFGVLSLGLLVLFLVLNAPFFGYVARRRGLWFGIRSAGFLFCEMLWAEVGLVAARMRSRGDGE